MSLKQPKEEKFFFNRNFFDTDVIEKEENAEPETEIVEKIAPPPPTFSEEDLKSAREKAYEAGKAEGYKSAQTSTAQSMLLLVKALQQEFEKLLTQEHQREEIFEKEVVKLCAALFEKITPELIDRYGKNILQDTISAALQDCKKEEKLTIHLHKEQHQQFEKILKDQGFQNFKINHEMIETPSSCRVEWQNGGTIFDIPALSEKIQGILHQFLEEKVTNSHDGIENKADTRASEEIKSNEAQPGEEQ